MLGNMKPVSRRCYHWFFPVEIGAHFAHCLGTENHIMRKCVNMLTQFFVLSSRLSSYKTKLQLMVQELKLCLQLVRKGICPPCGGITSRDLVNSPCESISGVKGSGLCYRQVAPQ